MVVVFPRQVMLAGAKRGTFTAGNRLITGEGSFATEPFIITGPAYPPFLALPREGEPWPPFDLATLEVVS